MSTIQTYEVLRDMVGDKDYKRGDTRQITEFEAKHLVSLGVLRLVKMAPPVAENKMEPPVSNKSEATAEKSPAKEQKADVDKDVKQETVNPDGKIEPEKKDGAAANQPENKSQAGRAPKAQQDKAKAQS